MSELPEAYPPEAAESTNSQMAWSWTLIVVHKTINEHTHGVTHQAMVDLPPDCPWSFDGVWDPRRTNAGSSIWLNVSKEQYDRLSIGDRFSLTLRLGGRGGDSSEGENGG